MVVLIFVWGVDQLPQIKGKESLQCQFRRGSQYTFQEVDAGQVAWRKSKTGSHWKLEFDASLKC